MIYPPISAFQFIKNGIKYQYPFIDSIKSVSAFVSEFIIIDGNSDDKTYEELKKLANINRKIRLIQIDCVDDWHRNRKLSDMLNIAITECKNEWCFLVHPDEIFSPDYLKDFNALFYKEEYKNIDAFIFPVMHFWKTKKHILWHPNPLSYIYKYFFNTIRLFKKKDSIQSIRDGWSIGGKGNFQFVDIPVFHYHFMRLKETIINEYRNQKHICHYIPEKYKVNHQNNKLSIDIRPFVSLKSQPPKFIINNALKKLLIIPSYTFQMSDYTNILGYIFSTGILQEKFNIHQITWLAPKHWWQIEGINFHGIPTKQKGTFQEFEFVTLKYIMELVRPHYIILIGKPNFFKHILPFLKRSNIPILGWFSIFNFNQLPPFCSELFEICKKIITFSPIKSFLPDKKINTISLGTDTMLFKCIKEDIKTLLRKKAGFNEKDFIFLIMGRLDTGVPFFIKAFTEVKKQYDCKLFIHTPLEPDTLKLLKKINNKSIIYMPDFWSLSLKEFADLYHISNVFIPSSIDETTEIFIRQALACGVQCIIPDYPQFKNLNSSLFYTIKLDSDMSLNSLTGFNDIVNLMVQTINQPRHSGDIINRSWRIVTLELLKEINLLGLK